VANCTCCGKETTDLNQGWRFMVPEASPAKLEHIRETQGEDEANIYFQLSRTTEKSYECRDCEELTTDEYHARRELRITLEKILAANPNSTPQQLADLITATYDGNLRTFFVHHARENEFTGVSEKHELAGVVLLPTEGDSLMQLDRVFELTNHIDRPWWTNPGVTKVAAHPERSTSVGDIIQCEDGRRWRVEREGFLLLS
jgi:hypothetical protein